MMNAKIYIGFAAVLITGGCYATSTLYCPQHAGYIDIGMTQAQVIAACGEPLSKHQSSNPVTVKVPVRQLIYTSINQGSVYPTLDPIYQQWSIPSGVTDTGVEVDIINNKISAIHVNGSNTNALTLCAGAGIKIGDDQSAVYNACGQPSLINDTYVNQAVPSTSLPEIWTYRIDQYQQPFSLTFLDGKLQSID